MVNTYKSFKMIFYYFESLIKNFKIYIFTLNKIKEYVKFTLNKIKDKDLYPIL